MINAQRHAFYMQYQTDAESTAIYPKTDVGLLYPYLGLAEEASEVAGKVADAINQGIWPCAVGSEEALVKELGDVMWMVSAICSDRGIQLSWVVSMTELIELHYSEGSLYTWMALPAAAGDLVSVTAKKVRKGEYPRYGMADMTVHGDEMNHLIRVVALVRACSEELGVSLDAVCEYNISKLKDRANRGVIEGSGDDR